MLWERCVLKIYLQHVFLSVDQCFFKVACLIKISSKIYTRQKNNIYIFVISCSSISSYLMLSRIHSFQPFALIISASKIMYPHILYLEAKFYAMFWRWGIWVRRKLDKTLLHEKNRWPHKNFENINLRKKKNFYLLFV